MRKVMLGALVCGLAAGAALGNDRVNVSQKGSLLIFPKIEIVYDAAGNVLQDTFITMTNDYNLAPDANLKMYFVNGDVNTTGCRWQCDFADATATLTPDQPAYWSVVEGRSLSNSGLSFQVVGEPIADPSGNGNFLLRGYLIVFAVYSGDDPGRVGELVRWNHLFGEATVVNYQDGTAYTYHAYAYRALAGVNTNDTVNANEEINLDGADYEYTFDKLIFNFFVDGSEALSNVETHSHEFDGDVPAADELVNITSDLTLMIVDQDFVGDPNDGNRIVGRRTLVRAVIWNENENKKTNTTRCVSCWDNTQLSSFAMGINWFTMDLGTDMGKAELMGEQNILCEVDVCPDDGKMRCQDPNDICVEYMDLDGNPAGAGTLDEYALLGVITKNLTFDMAMARAATTLNGKGDATATMYVDTHGGGGATDESPIEPVEIDPFESPIRPSGQFSQLQRQ